MHIHTSYTNTVDMSLFTVTARRGRQTCHTAALNTTTLPSGLIPTTLTDVSGVSSVLYYHSRVPALFRETLPFQGASQLTEIYVCQLYQYARFIQLMERLLSLPNYSSEAEFVQRYRRQLDVQSSKQQVKPLQYNHNGIAYSTADGRRKTATCTVLLRDCGSGSVSINGEDHLHYFPILQDREQLMFPLHFMDMLGRFDLECSVSGGGRTGQAGALRLAISRAMLSFLSEGQVESMRQAGLLTPDPRVRERKKPGQEGARRKYTWKKR
ncbi:hypothetical protein UPYG_G00024200 [Umbra pygmaea]|uniref:Small ribosomal subunit protein uS9m n=1 Tax=Umbra pygmaea TaxID=75934 RepID=A0ABD0XLH3_UMBPY